MTVAPETLCIDDERPASALTERVDAALRGGGLVALPTETVYGIGARADSRAAVADLRRLKRKGSAEPLTWHVGSQSALAAFPRISPLVERLVERYWPGPLTLVLPGVPAGLGGVAREGWTGVRLPAHRGTAGLLAALDYPVVLTSANLHGAEPLTDAAAVAEAFGGALELVVDGGPSRMGEASGVLLVGEGRFELLREGLLPVADLRRTAGLRLGFVCTGNTCRSPMAEALARHMLRERLQVRSDEGLARFGFEVSSMGVFARLGSPATEEAVAALAERGIDISRHASKPTVPERLAHFDRLYCLTRSHREALTGLLPPGRAGHLSLLDKSGEDIPDPIGGSRETYRRCAEHIARCVRERLDEWA